MVKPMAKPRSFSRHLLPLVAVAAAGLLSGLFGYLRADPARDGDRFYLRSNGGAVLFTHAAHQDRSPACERCHHELVSGAARACTDCHDDGYTADLASHDELQAVPDHTCAGCHEVAAAATARNCRDCHPREAGEGEPRLSCQNCHDDGYSADLASHAELVAIADHTCEGCHTIRSVADVYHLNCNACHLAAAPARFGDADGKPVCRSCHLK
jgi:hypothetical protein